MGKPRQRERVRFIMLVLGVLVMHTLVTILEERLFSIASFRNQSGGAFMTLFMYLFCVFVYIPQVRMSGNSLPPSAYKMLLFVSTIYVGTTTLTKTSLRYLDMPTQTVLKSAKLLPVMAGSIAILGKSYSAREWMAALMLCSGVVIFNMSTNHPEFRSTIQGGVCIFVALICDAMLGCVCVQRGWSLHRSRPLALSSPSRPRPLRAHTPHASHVVYNAQCYTLACPISLSHPFAGITSKRCSRSV